MIVFLASLAPCLIAAYFYVKMIEYREKYEMEKLLDELKGKEYE